MKKYLCGLFRHEPVTVKNKDEAREAFHCADCSDFPSCYGGPRRTALPHEYKAPVKCVQVLADVVNLPKPKQETSTNINYSEFAREHFDKIIKMRDSHISWEDICKMCGIEDHVSFQNVFTKIRRGVKEDEAIPRGDLLKIIENNFESIKERLQHRETWRCIQVSIPELHPFSLDSLRVVFRKIKARRINNEQA